MYVLTPSNPVSDSVELFLCLFPILILICQQKVACRDPSRSQSIMLFSWHGLFLCLPQLWSKSTSPDSSCLNSHCCWADKETFPLSSTYHRQFNQCLWLVPSDTCMWWGHLSEALYNDQSGSSNLAKAAVAAGPEAQSPLQPATDWRCHSSRVPRPDVTRATATTNNTIWLKPEPQWLISCF